MRKICSPVTIIILGLLWMACGQKQPLSPGDEGISTGSARAGKPAVAEVALGKNQAIIVATVTRAGTPLAGLEVALSRSVSGLMPDFAWKATTGTDGVARITISSDPWKNVSGYYMAKATDAAGQVVGEWGSIPVMGGKEEALWLPIGRKASISKQYLVPTTGVLVEADFYSTSIAGNPMGNPALRRTTIYLPPGYYTSTKRYPTLYLIHGSGGDYRSWAYNTYPEFVYAACGRPVDFPGTGFASMINDAIASGKTKEIIIVMPDISTLYGGSYCINSLLNGNFEDFLIKEIVPYVDTHYRSLATRDSRAIEGISMGGYASMYLAMRHADVFAAVSSHNAPLVMVGTFDSVRPIIAAENPTGFTGPDPNKPVTSFLYMGLSAMAPNLANPPFYVDMVFDDGMQIRNDVIQKMSAYDPLLMIPTYSSNLLSLKGIYLDGGDKDQLGMNLATKAFSDALKAAGISNRFESYDGNHLSKLYTRLGASLGLFSQVLATGQ